MIISELPNNINFKNDNIELEIRKSDFFTSLYKNYKTSNKIQKKILRQLILDFNRQSIFINNELCENIFEVLDFIYNNLSNTNTHIFHEILLLAQQTALSIPLGLLQQKMLPNVIGECENGNKMKIKLGLESVIVTKKLRLINYDNGKTLSNIFICMIYNLSSENVIIQYEIRSNLYGFELI